MFQSWSSASSVVKKVDFGYKLKFLLMQNDWNAEFFFYFDQSAQAMLSIADCWRLNWYLNSRIINPILHKEEEAKLPILVFLFVINPFRNKTFISN